MWHARKVTQYIRPSFLQHVRLPVMWAAGCSLRLSLVPRPSGLKGVWVRDYVMHSCYMWLDGIAVCIMCIVNQSDDRTQVRLLFRDNYNCQVGYSWANIDRCIISPCPWYQTPLSSLVYAMGFDFLCMSTPHPLWRYLLTSSIPTLW